MIQTLLASFKTSWRWWLAIMAVVIVVGSISTLSILLANSRSDLSTAESDNRVLQSDNALQGQVIAAQAFNINRFNKTAQLAAQANAIVAAGSEKTVIKYREILRREKTCDLPVPADIAGGLLEYTNRLRASAMHADSGNVDTADNGTTTTGTLTYCQAVLWITPLLAAIEKANNQLDGIREIEESRGENTPSY